MRARFLTSVFALFVCWAEIALAQGPVVQLPGLGYVQGKEKLTKGNLAYPQKTYYSFRNIPFANTVSGEKRFTVLKLIATTINYNNPSTTTSFFRAFLADRPITPLAYRILLTT